MNLSNITSKSSDAIEENQGHHISPTDDVVATSDNEKTSRDAQNGDTITPILETETIEEEDTSKYLTGEKRVVLSLSLSLVVFILGMVRLGPTILVYLSLRRPVSRKQDGTIVATAVPTISNQFNSLKDVGWYGSAL